MADDRYAVCNKEVKRSRPSQEASAEVEAYISVGDHIVFINDLSGRAALGDERRKTLMSQSRMIEERAGEPLLHLAVIGEFSSWKSTFINALLRRRLLKSAHLPTTASATFLVYAETFSVNVRFKEGKVCRATESNFHKLRNHVARIKKPARYSSDGSR